MKHQQSSFVLKLLCLCGIFAMQASAFQRLARSPSRSWGRLSISTVNPRQTRFFASFDKEEETTNYDEEETLLQMHLSVLPDIPMEIAIGRVSKYSQSFPFAAALPVQPLQYLPTPDGGVDVRFMRKKTQEKGSLDGGIRFFVSQAERGGIEVVAKRNSEGQTVSKMFSEKLVVQAFVKGISGETPDKTSPAPTDVAAMESVFHKWL
jgi:hypothetical protein